MIINLQRKIRQYLNQTRIRQISQLNYENTLQDTKNINTESNGGRRHRANKSSIKFKADIYQQGLINKDNESQGTYQEKYNNLNKNYNPNTQQYVKDFRYQNAIFTGNLMEGMRHGKGIQIWDDGAKYDGDWKFDQANGYGTFYYIDGDIYQGQWENDKANGEGTYYNVDGATYQGEWKDDLQDGYGCEQWKDGSSYKGYYKYGMKNGYGDYLWADRSKYEGYWKENKQNGHVPYFYYFYYI